MDTSRLVSAGEAVNVDERNIKFAKSLVRKPLIACISYVTVTFRIGELFLLWQLTQMYKFRKFLCNENSPGFEELDL